MLQSHNLSSLSAEPSINVLWDHPKTSDSVATVAWRAKRQSSQKMLSRTLSTETLNEHTTKILKIVWIEPWQTRSWLFVNPPEFFLDKFVRTFFTESNEIWIRWAAPTMFFSHSPFWHLCVFISSQQALNWPLRKETETLWHNGKHDEMHMHAHNQDRTAHMQARQQLCTQPLHAQPQRKQCSQNCEKPDFCQILPFSLVLGPEQCSETVMVSDLDDVLMSARGKWGRAQMGRTDLTGFSPDFTFSSLSGYALYLWKHMISRHFKRSLTGC